MWPFWSVRLYILNKKGWSTTCSQGRNYHWGKWGNCLTKMSVNFFLINDLQRCLMSCVSLYVEFSQVVSSCSNGIIVSLFRMLLYVGVHSASNRMYVPHLVTLCHLRIDRNFCSVHEEITSIRLYTPGDPRIGLRKGVYNLIEVISSWTEQIISINPYKLIHDDNSTRRLENDVYF